MPRRRVPRTESEIAEFAGTEDDMMAAMFETANNPERTRRQTAQRRRRRREADRKALDGLLDDPGDADLLDMDDYR